VSAGDGVFRDVIDGATDVEVAVVVVVLVGVVVDVLWTVDAA
jgi:Flp pilus assembly pilin Flp